MLRPVYPPRPLDFIRGYLDYALSGLHHKMSLRDIINNLICDAKNTPN
jgi:hypothetical protein